MRGGNRNCDYTDGLHRHVARTTTAIDRSSFEEAWHLSARQHNTIKTRKASMRQSTQCRPHGQQGQGYGVIEGYVLGGRNSVSSSFAYDDGRVTQLIVYRTTDR